MISGKSWIVAIYLGVTILLGGDGLSAAGPVKNQPDDAKARMEAEGWKQISEGVFERRLGPNKVEHLSFGRGGLAWIINELTRQLEFMMIEHESYPSEDLAEAIDGLSVKIARAKREMRKMRKMRKASQGISSMTEAVEGASCSDDCYSATGNAYPLTSTQGVGADAQAWFNCACGYSGHTYAYANARATQGTTMTDTRQEDPRTGTDVTSSASASMNGQLDCFSEAYASVSIPALEIFRSFSDINYSCPPPDFNVSMSGPSSVNFTSATCSTQTWSASVSGGTTPYSYEWYVNGTQVGTGTSYSRNVCYNGADFTIQVTATDSSSPVQSKSDSRAVDLTYAPPPVPLDVTMSGPASIFLTTGRCVTATWSAAVSGGSTPYSYKWYYNGTQVGTGTSYSRSVCHNHADFTIQVTVTDSSSPVQTQSVPLAVDVVNY
jgi:hypothetical protein